MNYLNQRIQQIEQKLQTTTDHLSLQEEEYQQLLEKMISIRNRYSKVILLLTEFVESFVEQEPSLLQRQNDIFLDIDQVKEAEELKNIEPETLVALGLVLLKQLQPYVQELSDSKHQANYQRKVASAQNSFDGQGSGGIDPAYAAAAEGFRNIEGLEGKNITLKQKEDDNKLSFMRKG